MAQKVCYAHALVEFGREGGRLRGATHSKTELIKRRLRAARKTPVLGLYVAMVAWGVSPGVMAAPDPAWANGLSADITPELREDLAQVDYSRLERREIEVVLRMHLPGEAGEQARAKALAPGAIVLRHGLEALARLEGKPSEASEQAVLRAFPDRVDTVQDLVAKDNQLWLIWSWTGSEKRPFLGSVPHGQKVSTREYAFYTFNDHAQIVDATYRADEINFALQAQTPLHIDAQTSESFPIPPLARKENNPDSPSTVSPSVLASMRSEAWPPLWPPILQDPQLQARLAHTPYTETEKRNIKAVVLMLTMDPAVRSTVMAPGTRGGALRNGMQDLARATHSKPGPGGGYNLPISEPDRQQQMEDIIAKGNKVWAIWRWWGTHKGMWYGAPGDNRPILAHEASLFTLKDGKITSSEMRANELEIAEQLGTPLSIPESPRSP